MGLQGRLNCRMQPGFIVVVKREKAKGLGAVEERAQHFDGSKDWSGRGNKQQPDNRTSRQRSGQGKQSAGNGNYSQFARRALSILEANHSRCDVREVNPGRPLEGMRWGREIHNLGHSIALEKRRRKSPKALTTFQWKTGCFPVQNIDQKPWVMSRHLGGVIQNRAPALEGSYVSSELPLAYAGVALPPRPGSHHRGDRVLRHPPEAATGYWQGI